MIDTTFNFLYCSNNFIIWPSKHSAHNFGYICHETLMKPLSSNIYHGSRNGLDWVSEGTKTTQTYRNMWTQRKTWIWLSGHLMEKLQHPGNSVWLSYERWTGKWGYYIQLNKDTWFILYSWIKGTGLDNLGGHSLDNGAVLRL